MRGRARGGAQAKGDGHNRRRRREQRARARAGVCFVSHLPHARHDGQPVRAQVRVEELLVRSALEGLGHEFRPHTGTRERKETGKRDEPHQPKERVNEWRRPGLPPNLLSCLLASVRTTKNPTHYTQARARAQSHSTSTPPPNALAAKREGERDRARQPNTKRHPTHPPLHFNPRSRARCWRSARCCAGPRSTSPRRAGRTR